MRRWLTAEERKTLTPDEKRDLRQERKADLRAGRPPWLKAATAKLGELTLDALELLFGLAVDAVEDAARSQLAKGRDKHDLAVSRVVEGAGLHGLGADVTEELAGELVWRAYREIAGGGDG